MEQADVSKFRLGQAAWSMPIQMYSEQTCNWRQRQPERLFIQSGYGRTWSSLGQIMNKATFSTCKWSKSKTNLMELHRTLQLKTYIYQWEWILVHFIPPCLDGEGLPNNYQLIPISLGFSFKDTWSVQVSGSNQCPCRSFPVPAFHTTLHLFQTIYLYIYIIYPFFPS